jgi:hypothetical protein
MAGATTEDKNTQFLPSADVDLSKPISELLRTETKSAHDEIHHSAAASALVHGQLARSEYVRVLFMLWHIYE